MTASVFLAKFWGWYLIIFFFILSYNPIRIRQIFEDLKDQKFVILVSFMAIILGLLSILFHNIWEPDWRIIITLLGWISLSLGLFLFIIPERTTRWLNIVNVKLIQTIYMLLFILGIFLLNMGYQLVPY